MSKRVLKTQAEVITRYRRIADLWATYYAKCAEGPEVFGREFYHAVGELLQGNPLENLELVHLDICNLEAVVFPGKVNNSGTQKHTYKKPTIRDRNCDD